MGSGRSYYLVLKILIDARRKLKKIKRSDEIVVLSDTTCMCYFLGLGSFEFSLVPVFGIKGIC